MHRLSIDGVSDGWCKARAADHNHMQAGVGPELQTTTICRLVCRARAADHYHMQAGVKPELQTTTICRLV
jgi:hypothetical protein